MYKDDACMWEWYVDCCDCNNWLGKCVEDCKGCKCYECKGREAE